MLQSGDEEHDGMIVVAFDDDQPTCIATLIELVQEWVELESIDGELHPYVDSTLNLLSDMTYALIKTVERMEPDDPHRQRLLEGYIPIYDYLQHIVERMLEKD